MPKDASHQVSRLRAIFAGVDHAIVRIKDEPQLLQEICRVAVAVGGFKLAWIGRVQPDGVVRPVAQAGVLGYLENINQIVVDGSVPEGRGVIGTAIREQRPVVVENILGHDSLELRRELARQFGLIYVAAFPLKVSGRVAGAFAVYAPQSESFNADEMELLTQMSHDISLALTAMAELTAREAAESQLRKLSRAVEQSPVSTVITDVSGNIEYVNPAFTRLTGYRAEEVRGKNPRFLKSGKFTPAEYQQLWQCITHGKIWSGEFHNRKKNGELFWVSASISPVTNREGVVEHFVAVEEDITQAKKMADELRALAAIVTSSGDAIFSTTPAGIITSWNRAAEELLGYRADEIIGRHALLLVPEEEQEMTRARILATQHGADMGTYEARRRHKNGTLVDVSIKISNVTDPAGEIIRLMAIYRDVSARKKLEQTVLKISAEERQRIGYELHDGLGQYLAGIAYKAGALEANLATTAPALAPKMQQLVQLMNEAVRQTRNLARGLSPVDFEVSGLPAALQELAAQTEQLFGVDCVYQCAGEPPGSMPPARLDAATNLALYRIAQEAIHNAIKHGQAGKIELALQTRWPQLTLSIRDNGIGFQNDAVMTGMGLRIMGHRADSIGGRLSVHARPEGGTEIRCLISQTSVLGAEPISP